MLNFVFVFKKLKLILGCQLLYSLELDDIQITWNVCDSFLFKIY